MYSFGKPTVPTVVQGSSNNSDSFMIIVAFIALFLMVASSYATGAYFFTYEETNCNKIENYFDCKMNGKCEWNVDDEECEYYTDNDTDTDTDTDTDNDTGVPYQIPLSADDDFCASWGQIHQDVPGCGRVCSSKSKRGVKTIDKSDFVFWDSEVTHSSKCIDSKIDKIWEVQGGGFRKLADGYTLSNYPVGTPVKCAKNDLVGNSKAVYRVMDENGTLRHYPDPEIASSWDSEWQNHKIIEDCKGFTLDQDFAKKEEVKGQEVLDNPPCKREPGDTSPCIKWYYFDPPNAAANAESVITYHCTINGEIPYTEDYDTKSETCNSKTSQTDCEGVPQHEITDSEGNKSTVKSCTWEWENKCERHPLLTTEYVNVGRCVKRTDTGYNEKQLYCDPLLTEDECLNNTIYTEKDGNWPSSDTCKWQTNSDINVEEYCKEKVKDIDFNKKLYCSMSYIGFGDEPQRSVCKWREDDQETTESSTTESSTTESSSSTNENTYTSVYQTPALDPDYICQNAPDGYVGHPGTCANAYGGDEARCKANEQCEWVERTN